MAESVDNSGLKLNTTVDEIAEYQKGLFDFAPLIPEVMNMRGTDSKLLVVGHRTRVEFIESYLDEMVPEWRISETEEDFMTLQSKDLGVDLSDARRAYWMTKAKLDKLNEEVEDKVTRHDLAGQTYEFLSGNFKDRMYEKTEKFVQAFFLEYGPP